MHQCLAYGFVPNKLQNPSYKKGKFHVLKVNEDNIQMSDFVEKTLCVDFENGSAFYQFTKMEEDLLSYKEVVRMERVCITYNLIPTYENIELHPLVGVLKLAYYSKLLKCLLLSFIDNYHQDCGGYRIIVY